MASLKSSMDRLFENFFEEWPSLAPRGGGEELFVPAVDLRETEDALIAEVEIPGMTQKDITVQVEGDLLIIRGERKREEEKKAKAFYRKEVSYGAFERQIPLPTGVDREKVEATYANGMLQVTLPKVASAKPKVVSVKVK